MKMTLAATPVSSAHRTLRMSCAVAVKVVLAMLLFRAPFAGECFYLATNKVASYISIDMLCTRIHAQRQAAGGIGRVLRIKQNKGFAMCLTLANNVHLLSYSAAGREIL